MKYLRDKAGHFSERPHFEPFKIDRICDDELRKTGLLPSTPSAIRIERFIEKRFGVTPQYDDVPDGVLGYTKFGKNGVEAIVISATLDATKGKIAERRLRTTLAHEAGHGLLHAYLFALGEQSLNLFDRESQADHKILCRDIQGEERKGRAYDGRWWEFQANRAIGGLLCPSSLVEEALKEHLVPSGCLGTMTLDRTQRSEAITGVSDTFDVNPVVARIRIDELYPSQWHQLYL